MLRRGTAGVPEWAFLALWYGPYPESVMQPGACALHTPCTRFKFGSLETSVCTVVFVLFYQYANYRTKKRRSLIS